MTTSRKSTLTALGLRAYEQAVFLLQNAEYCANANAHIKELESQVVLCAQGVIARAFARDIPGADIEALQGVLLRECSPSTSWDCFWFARDIPGANVELLYNHVKKHGFPGMDREAIRQFAQLLNN